MATKTDNGEWGSDLDPAWAPLQVPDPEQPLPSECAEPATLIDQLRAMGWRSWQSEEEDSPDSLAGDLLDALYGRDLLDALAIVVDERADFIDEDGELLPDDDGSEISIPSDELEPGESEEPEGWSVIVPAYKIETPPPKELLTKDVFAFALRKLTARFAEEDQRLHTYIAAQMARGLAECGEDIVKASRVLTSVPNHPPSSV